jgi:hypothetical protein
MPDKDGHELHNQSTLCKSILKPNVISDRGIS